MVMFFNNNHIGKNWYQFCLKTDTKIYISKIKHPYKYGKTDIKVV